MFQVDDLLYFFFERNVLVLLGSCCMLMYSFEAFFPNLMSYGFTFAWPTRCFERAAIIALHALRLPRCPATRPDLT